jgi:hypothetical protein
MHLELSLPIEIRQRRDGSNGERILLLRRSIREIG